MKNYVILGLVTLFMSSCAEQVTRLAQYPKMYEEKPLTIAVMPPINQTNSVEAKDYLRQTFPNSATCLEQMLPCLLLSSHGKETRLEVN